MTKQQWLLSQIAQFPELSARELTGKLNEKILVNNPETQKELPLIPSLEEILEVITPQERFAIAETRTYDRILDAVNQQKINWIIGNLQILIYGGVLSEANYNKIIEMLQRTQPDPNYQAQILISPAELAGYGAILVSDVEELMV